MLRIVYLLLVFNTNINNAKPEYTIHVYPLVPDTLLLFCFGLLFCTFFDVISTLLLLRTQDSSCSFFLVAVGLPHTDTRVPRLICLFRLRAQETTSGVVLF